MSARPGAAAPTRFICLGLAALSILLGLAAALARIGASGIVLPAAVVSSHGVLMVYGFLGTAIGLERAVSLASTGPRRDSLAYLVPLLNGSGAILLFAAAILQPDADLYRRCAGTAWALAQGLLCVCYLVFWRRARSFATLISLLASTAGMAGAALWASGIENALLVPWWTMFLVLTIIAERIELARIEFAAGALERRLLLEALIVYASLPVTLLSPDWGYPLLGLALAAIIVDTGSHDIARRTIRLHGLPRFMATCLLVGYAWALVASLIWVTEGPVLSGYRYDAVIHSLTLGFVMSMIVAHAPIIVPAIIRRPLPYHPVVWATWGVLQASLVLRVLFGIRQDEAVWRFAGGLAVVALLGFLVTTVVLVATRRQSR